MLLTSVMGVQTEQEDSRVDHSSVEGVTASPHCQQSVCEEVQNSFEVIVNFSSPPHGGGCDEAELKSTVL